MFTTNLEDGREAPSKARKKGAKRLECLVTVDIQTLAKFKQSFIFFLTIRLPNEDMLSERKIS